MSFIRVIPTLLIKDQGLVKTVNFKNPNYIGDPINAVRIFNEKEVDELVLLDISATKNKSEPRYAWIKDIVSESFMPIGYGGGITKLDQIKKLFDLGVEKVIINSASEDVSLLKKAASQYGSQSIAVCIDVKKGFMGNEHVCFASGTKKKKMKAEIWAKKMEEAGAGEIILQSIEDEGSMKGYNLDLIKRVSAAVKVPVVASGGAGSLQDIQDAIHAGAAACTAGSMFVYKGKQRGILINYPTRVQLDELERK